jgi:branched-subunit amino acid transport protein AzlD
MIQLVKVVWWTATALGAVILLILTIVTLKGQEGGVIALTFPGIWCFLVITGVHGGSNHETLGYITAVAVNMGFVVLPSMAMYFLLSRGLRK